MRVRGVLWKWGMASACVVLAVGGCAGDSGNAGDVEPSDSIEHGGGTTADAGTAGSSSSPTAATSPPAPLPKALDGAAVEKSVQSVLAGSYGIAEVERVSCPPQPPVREDTAFDCTAFIAGEQQRVPIKIVNDEGVYEVGLPV